MPMGGASVSTCRDPRTSSPDRPRRKGTTGHPAGSGLDTLVRTARGLASSPRVTPQTTPSRLAYITGRCTHVLTVQSTPQLVALSGVGGMRPGFDCRFARRSDLRRPSIGSHNFQLATLPPPPPPLQITWTNRAPTTELQRPKLGKDFPLLARDAAGRTTRRGRGRSPALAYAFHPITRVPWSC